MNTVQDRERCLCVVSMDNPYPDFVSMCREMGVSDPDGLMDEILRYVFLAEFSGIYDMTYGLAGACHDTAAELEQAISQFIDNNEMALLEDLDTFYKYIGDPRYKADNLWFVSDFSPCMRYISIQLRHYDEDMRRI